MIWGQAALVPATGRAGTLLLGLLLGAISLHLIRSGRHRRWGVGLVAFALVLIPLSAGALALPFTFSNGTVADANQVNSNFDTVKTAIEGGPAIFMNRNFQNLTVSSSGTTVAKLMLPAGRYLMQVKLRYTASGMDSVGSCVFQGVGIGGFDASANRLTPGFQVDGVLMDTVLKQPGDDPEVRVVCFGTGGTVNVINSQFAATRGTFSFQ